MPTMLGNKVHNLRFGDMSSGDHLDTPVRHIMTPGIVSIVEEASIASVYRAMTAHGVHALLVLGAREGKPLGWITAHGLLRFVDGDAGLTCAREAISEPPETIEPSASAREALSALMQAGASHLLVTQAPGMLPEGVVTDMDLIELSRG